MLRTKPAETKSSMSCQVVSKDIVVSMSNIPSLANSLLVLPTPLNIRIKIKYENSFNKQLLHTKFEGLETQL